MHVICSSQSIFIKQIQLVVSGLQLICLSNLMLQIYSQWTHLYLNRQDNFHAIHQQKGSTLVDV